MARKDVLVSKLLTAQSLSSSFTSPPTVVKYLDNCAYQINVTTTNSIGTFKVQASCDYAVDLSGAVTASGSWADLDIGGTPIVNSADDTILINLNQLPFNAIRLVYTSSTPGTGTCDVIVEAKQIGG